MSRKVKIAANMVIGSMLLSGCQTSPHVAEISKPQDSMLTCSQIYTEIEQTKRYKVNARANDEFSFRYILIFPAMWNMYEWIVAENAADDRLDALDGLKQNKNCSESGMGGSPYGTENYPYGGRVNNNPTNSPYGNIRQPVNPYANGIRNQNIGNIPAIPHYGRIPQQIPTNKGTMPNDVSIGLPPSVLYGNQAQQNNPYNMQQMPAGNIDSGVQPYSAPTTQLPEGRRRPKNSGF
jgi:hypothetical protein